LGDGLGGLYMTKYEPKHIDYHDKYLQIGFILSLIHLLYILMYY